MVFSGLFAGAEPPGPSLTLLARTGQPAPGTESLFTRLDLIPVGLNEKGAAVFRAQLLDGREAVYRATRDGLLSLVVIAGQSAPGPGGTFRDFFPSRAFSVNDHDHVAFDAILTDVRRAVYRAEKDGALTLLALDREPAPGTGKRFRMSGFNLGILLNEHGQVLFDPPLQNGSESRAAYRAERDGTLTLVFQSDDFFELFSSPFNKHGQVGLGASLPLFQGEAIVVSDKKGVPSIVARTGQSAPGGDQFDTFQFFSSRLNEKGEAMIVADLRRFACFPRIGCFFIFAGSGVYRLEQNGTLTLLVRSQPPPVSGGTIAAISDPRFNNVGQAVVPVAFGDGTRALIRTEHQPGVVTLLAKEGQSAPGTNAAFRSIFFPRAELRRNGVVSPFNDGGLVVFSALLTNGQTALYRAEKDGTLTLLARTGQAAPGTATTFAGVDREPTINEADQTVFSAGLAGGTEALYRAEKDGSLTLLVRSGQPAPGAPTTFLRFTTSGGGRPQVNRAGQVLFFSELADGTTALYLAE